jgi:hypothetical protein
MAPTAERSLLSIGEKIMYHVDLSGETHHQIKALFVKASREGRAESFLAAFKKICHRLEQDPEDFGEPLYHLSVLKVQVRKAVIIPLAVDYSVSKYHHNIVIKGIKLMDAH